MSDWFSPSNIIGGLGALFGFIALPLAIWIYFKQKTKKELTYQIVLDTPVVSVNRNVKGVVEVTLDGKPMKDARVVVIKVWNSGNSEVAKEDYDTPVSFEFINRTVVSGEVLSTEPEDLMPTDVQKAFLRLQSNIVSFPEYLLNQGQSVRMSVLTSGKKGEIKQRGRIRGGEIHLYMSAPTGRLLLFIVIMATVCDVVISVSLILSAIRDNQPIWVMGAIVGFSIAAMFVVVALTYRYIHSFRKAV